jgi:hypothetical protein
MLVFPLLRQAILLTLLAGSAFPQSWTDGLITVEPGVSVRSSIGSPPLPPNSTEIFVDSGIYTGYSRNLQNDAIQAGWSYWAHAVRLTPPPTAQGRLLEVRYVAVAQWGLHRAFDVVIRDAASGAVMATLLNQTAVLDTQNWQVIDVAALNFTVGALDFLIELRPATACNGDNGFTLAYSATSSTFGSSVSSSCSDLFSDFHADPRELFLRAVVENGGLPTVTASATRAGFATTLTAVNLSANAQAVIAYSLTGAGPVVTRFGVYDLSLPIGRITVSSDASGAATTQIYIPTALAGASVWLQVVDLVRGVIGTGVEFPIQ